MGWFLSDLSEHSTTLLWHNNISHQTQKIRIKVHFHLFSIVNVNRTTLSSSYCNDCLEMISPHLNDRPIFSYRHQPISMMVVTKVLGSDGFTGDALYIGIMALRAD